ncbi:MAG: hypothetical protein ACR2JV_04180 [Gaiellales bacterium]
MSQYLAMCLGFAAVMFIPFLGLGIAIRIWWVPVAFAVVGPAIWIPGLGVGVYAAAAIGSLLGAGAGIALRRARLARRARPSDTHPDAAPGGTS